MSERYAVNRDNARWRIVDGEAVVINLTNTHYYSLNKTGTFIWNLLVEGDLSVDEIVGEIVVRYGQSGEAVLPDVRNVLEELAREDLEVTR
jgi:hypothetical protein